MRMMSERDNQFSTRVFGAGKCVRYDNATRGKIHPGVATFVQVRQTVTVLERNLKDRVVISADFVAGKPVGCLGLGPVAKADQHELFAAERGRTIDDLRDLRHTACF